MSSPLLPQMMCDSVHMQTTSVTAFPLAICSLAKDCRLEHDQSLQLIHPECTATPNLIQSNKGDLGRMAVEKIVVPAIGVAAHSGAVWAFIRWEFAPIRANLSKISADLDKIQTNLDQIREMLASMER